MKIKDLAPGTTLSGKKVKTPKGVVGEWFSQWEKGVWLMDGKSTRIYPQFVDTIKDCLEWEITEDKINCHVRTDFHSIDNTKLSSDKNDESTASQQKNNQGTTA